MPDEETAFEPGAETVGATSNVKPEAGPLPMSAVIDACDKDSSTKTCACTVSCILGFVVMWILFLVGVLFFTVLEIEVQELVEALGKEIRNEKGNVGIVILCIAGGCLFNALPLPGKAAWNLVIGYVYGWVAFPILLAGHGLGGCSGFYLARLLWPYIDKSGILHRCCTCCCPNDANQDNRCTSLLLTRVEEKPMLSMCLLTLSPAPVPLISYFFGAKCPTVTWWQFLIALTVGGVKLIVPTYFGVKAEDVNKLIEGWSSNHLARIFEIVPVLILALTVWLSRRPYQILQYNTKDQPILRTWV